MKGMVIVMTDKDFADLGREIGEKIDKFVNSKEIKDLQENIRLTVENTMNDVYRSAKEAAESASAQMRAAQMKAAQMKTSQVRYSNAGTTQVRPYERRQLPVVKRPPGRVAGVLMTVFGTCGAVIGWTSALVGYSLTFVSLNVLGVGTIGVSAAIAGMAGICTAMAVGGGALRRRARRFRNYVRTMGAKDFYSIEGLAQAVRKKESFVIKDLKKMIKRGWFKEGHLDEQETCFMLTNESYQLYLDASEELKRRKEEEERMAKERELLEQDPVRKRLIVTIEEGKEYIRRIREINDDIPGEDISNKLYRLENICTRIFEHIEDNPEKLEDIRKFMSYYLPTTLKLVETYHEFSLQPVQGENITTSKKEIEDMLDDINLAFEKMFDKLFEDDAMDISTDISVLSTMLAQEGLLEDEFKVK